MRCYHCKAYVDVSNGYDGVRFSKDGTVICQKCSHRLEEKKRLKDSEKVTIEKQDVSQQSNSKLEESQSTNDSERKKAIESLTPEEQHAIQQLHDRKKTNNQGSEDAKAYKIEKENGPAGNKVDSSVIANVAMTFAGIILLLFVSYDTLVSWLGSREAANSAIVVGAAYFLPYLLAMLRGHLSAGAIFMTVLLLGWTGIGWIVALIWACTGNTRSNLARRKD